MDGKLLEILCCPVTKRPLVPLDATRREALDRAVAEGTVRYVDDSTVTGPIEEALVTDDGHVVYLVLDGIPVLLPERGVGTTQFENFAEGRL